MAQGSRRRHGPGAIQVITRAVDLLRALGGEPQGLSLSQLAERANLPRSTVHRLLSALEHEGLVSPATSSGRMRLGPELLRLADAGRPDLQAQLRPVMQDLHETVEETVDLAVLEGDHLRFVDQIAAPHRLRAVSSVGARFPLHCTANGKAVLAELLDDDVRALLPEKLARYTPATITARKRLLDELKEIRRTGVAFDREEHTVGISAVGIATASPHQPIVAISVPMPTQRFDGREPAITAAVVTARADMVKTLDPEP